MFTPQRTMIKVLKKEVHDHVFGLNIKVFGVSTTATTILAAFVCNFPQHQGM